jgi:hypothetical protein
LKSISFGTLPASLLGLEKISLKTPWLDSLRAALSALEQFAARTHRLLQR